MGVVLGLSHKGKNIEGFENRVLRRMFGPKREDVAGGGRRLHIEELQNLYALPNIRVNK
jgi:hypothetical protein